MLRKISTLSAALVLTALVTFGPAHADNATSDPYDPPGGALPTLGEIAVDAVLFLANYPGLSSWVMLP